MKHVNLQDVVEANNLLISMGAEDQLPRIASAAIERSLELQHRVDRAIRYAEEAHSSSLHVKQVLRILDGSITIDDEMNEVPEKEYPHLVQRAAHEQQSLPATPPPMPQHGPSGLAGRSTEQRKAFREWLKGQGIELPLNMAVPQVYVDAFDKATDGQYRPIQRRVYNRSPYSGTRGKLKPGHGLEGRSQKERLHMREWLAEQGFDINPTGRIPQKHIDHYDAAMAELQRMQREKREQPQEREQEAQGA